MNKDLSRVVEVPEKVEVAVNGNEVIVKGNGNELIKKFDKGKVSLTVADNKITISAKGATRRESKMIGTIWACINNMIKGVCEDFVYTLEICNVHFPMNVKVEGNEVIIKSFIGETVKRVAKILPKVKVDIKGNKITVSSCDIEAAGQTAANLEKATRLTGRDRRIFQDGIFMIEKPRRKI
ncbi:MAG: 50S ribosomal protein L6 [Nanoarchaeota archaeon]|nr:50S ribosomal protein L6 [Nanoarchaeota archaeon]